MGNTTKWIPQTEKIKLVKRIQKMPETRDKHILTDVFINEMSCKQVANSMRYLSNRGKPISHRQVINVVKGFYPEYGYSGVSKGKGSSRSRNPESRKAKELFWILIDERGPLCEQCKKRGVPLQLHHIIPVAFGGKTDRDNCLILCVPCHNVETQKQKWGEYHKGWQERKETKDGGQKE